MICQLKVTLADVEPRVWRRIQASGELTLAQLHVVLQIVMGWTNAHLHQFIIAGARYAASPSFAPNKPPIDERKVRLRDFAKPKGRFRYEYDFGDEWEHDILIEKILAEKPLAPALCLDGKRACPPEDCGGHAGYTQLLEILTDPAHDEYGERIEWVGHAFDPEEFNLPLVNQLLGRNGPRLHSRARP